MGKKRRKRCFGHYSDRARECRRCKYWEECLYATLERIFSE